MRYAVPADGANENARATRMPAIAADPAATAKVQAYMLLTLTPIMPAAAGSSDPARSCRPNPVRVTTRCVAYSNTIPAASVIT